MFARTAVFASALALSLTALPLAPVLAQPTPPAADPAPPAVAPAPPAAAAAPEADKPAPVGEIVELTNQPALTYLGETDWDDAEKALSEAVNRLYAAAARAKLEVAGPPMIEYLDTSGTDFRFTGYLPLKTTPATPPAGGVKLGATPAGKALRFIHQGAYEDLEGVYASIDDELAARGQTMKRVVEEYVSDPASTQPDQMVTHIYVFTE